jgi:hypothetical protein
LLSGLRRPAPVPVGEGDRTGVPQTGGPSRGWRKVCPVQEVAGKSALRQR